MQRRHCGRRWLGVGQPKLAGVQRRHFRVGGPDGRVVPERRAVTTRAGRGRLVVPVMVASGPRAVVHAVAGPVVVAAAAAVAAECGGPRAGRQRAVSGHRPVAGPLGRRRGRQGCPVVARLRTTIAARHRHRSGQLFSGRQPDVRLVRPSPPVVPPQNPTPASPRITCGKHVTFIWFDQDSALSGRPLDNFDIFEKVTYKCFGLFYIFLLLLL